MKKQNITPEDLSAFSRHLQQEERASGTVEKYLRDIRAFAAGSEIDKAVVTAWKERLISAAKSERLKLLMEMICATGIRVSEVKHITVEALQSGKDGQKYALGANAPIAYCDYVEIEEYYDIMDPSTIAQALRANRPAGGYLPFGYNATPENRSASTDRWGFLYSSNKVYPAYIRTQAGMASGSISPAILWSLPACLPAPFRSSRRAMALRLWILRFRRSR